MSSADQVVFYCFSSFCTDKVIKELYAPTRPHNRSSPCFPQGARSSHFPSFPVPIPHCRKARRSKRGKYTRHCRSTRSSPQILENLRVVTGGLQELHLSVFVLTISMLKVTLLPTPKITPSALFTHSEIRICFHDVIGSLCFNYQTKLVSMLTFN